MKNIKKLQVQREIVLITSVVMSSLFFTHPLSAIVYVWHYYNGHEYALTSELYHGIDDSGPLNLSPNVFDAEEEANAQGGHLVTINDSLENDWLATVFNDRQYWIGFTDWGSEGDWYWLSGESSTYTNWDTGQPDDGNGGEDSATFNHYSVHHPDPIGVWNDLGNATYGNHTQLPTRGIIERVSGIPESKNLGSIFTLIVMTFVGLRRFRA